MEHPNNRVPREVLWDVLKEKGVPTVNVKISQDMYEEVRTRVKRVCVETDGFMVKVGSTKGRN